MERITLCQHALLGISGKIYLFCTLFYFFDFPGRKIKPAWESSFQIPSRLLPFNIFSIFYIHLSLFSDLSFGTPPVFMLLIVFSNVFMLTGFEIWVFIPAARECCILSYYSQFSKTSFSLFISNGFARCPFMPVFFASCTSSAKALAVMATIGNFPCSPGRLLIAAVAS